MVNVRADREQNCLTVTLNYGNVSSYLVDVRPDALASRFQASNVRTVLGKPVQDDTQHHLGVQAVAEVFGWFKEKLEPPTHYRAADMRERVLRAFLVQLSRTDEPRLKRLRPLDDADVRLLTLAALNMNERIKQLKQDARTQRRKLAGGYLDDVKAGVLSEMMDKRLLPKDRRDWYSQVLGLAFSWKGGQVPRADYEEAERLLPGFRCLVGSGVGGT